MWFIAKGVLKFLDGFFDIIDKIWRYKFFDNEYVNKVFGGAIIVACSWLVLKVTIELIMNYIVKSDSKNNPLTIYRGIALAIIMMFLISPLFDFGHKFSTALTDDVIKISGLEKGSESESKISEALISSMSYTDEMEKEDMNYLIKNWKNIEINDTIGGLLKKDVYKYSLNFFMLIVLSVITIFLFFFVAIQMAKRVMEIALFKIIGPFCCTSLTNNGKAFETWCKSSLGLFLITTVQFVSIGLMLAMFGSAFQDNGNIVGIFLIIGALLFIISTPTIINSLLGQQTGMMSAFGDMQSLMAIGHASTQGLGLAKAGVEGALSIGSKVIGGGNKLAGKGISWGFDKFKNKNNMSNNQKDTVRDTMSTGNSFKARQQTNGFSNGTNNFESGFNSKPFNNTNNMNFNTFHSQFMNKNNKHRGD